MNRVMGMNLGTFLRSTKCTDVNPYASLCQYVGEWFQTRYFRIPRGFTTRRIYGLGSGNWRGYPFQRSARGLTGFFGHNKILGKSCYVVAAIEAI
jgi:hypothetical protein